MITLAHKYRNKLCTLGLGCLSNLSCGSRVNISVNFSHYISHNQSCVYIQCSQPAHRAQSKSSKAGTEWLAGNKKPFRLTRGIIIQGVMSTGEQPRIKDYVAPYHQENLRMSGSLCHPGSKLNFILEKIKWNISLTFEALLNQIHYGKEEKLGIGVKGWSCKRGGSDLSEVPFKVCSSPTNWITSLKDLPSIKKRKFYSSLRD